MAGVPWSQVLLAATHTHSAPAAQPLRHWGEQVLETLPRMERGFVRALSRARRTLRPVLAVEARWVRVSRWLFNRDSFAGEVPPEERTDPYLRALLFRSEGATRAVVSFACHPVVLGPNYAVSADYPGALLRELGAAGIEALFLLGTHGDVDPIVQKRKGWGRGTPADVLRMGRGLARRCHRARGKEMPLADFGLAGRQWQVELPLDIPSLSQLRRMEREARRKRDSEPGRPACMHNLMVEWAREAQARLRSGKVRPTQRVTLQRLRLGPPFDRAQGGEPVAPLSIVGIPMEVYTGVGHRLRQALAPRPLWVVSGANGTVNYLPTPLAYERGAYSAHFAPKIYGLLGYRPEVAEAVVDSVLAHLDAS